MFVVTLVSVLCSANPPPSPKKYKFDGRYFLDILVWLISKYKAVYCLLVKIKFLFSSVIFCVNAWKKNIMLE